MSKPFEVEITSLEDFHCFKLTINPRSAPQAIEIMLHASSLVELIHECSTKLGEWQKQTTTYLLMQRTGLSEQQLREEGLIA